MTAADQPTTEPTCGWCKHYAPGSPCPLHQEQVAPDPATERAERLRAARTRASRVRERLAAGRTGLAVSTSDFLALDDEVTRLEGVVAKQAAMHDGFIRSLATANGRSDDAERTAWGLPTTTQDRPEETRP